MHSSHFILLHYMETKEFVIATRLYFIMYHFNSFTFTRVQERKG